jgi:hypothetical protein
MSLGNTALWGDVLPGGPLSDSAAGNLDTTQVIDELLASLHAGSRSDLTWWTEGDLIQWMDEALKRLARVACVFVGRYSSTLTVPAQATYSQPAAHITTLDVSYLATSLEPASQMELESRDVDYQTTPGTPDHWYEDLLGGATTGLAPVPTDQQTLAWIYEGFPAALDAGRQQTLVAAPSPLKGYLAMTVLKEAYGREGEMESADIADHAQSRMDLYEKLFTTYYGSGTV